MGEKQALPCIACGRALEAVYVSDAAVQPRDGVTFRGAPGYGSAFDLTPGELEIVVCDTCLDERCQRVARVVTTHTVTARRETWNPDALG